MHKHISVNRMTRANITSTNQFMGQGATVVDANELPVPTPVCLTIPAGNKACTVRLGVTVERTDSVLDLVALPSLALQFGLASPQPIRVVEGKELVATIMNPHNKELVIPVSSLIFSIQAHENIKFHLG